MRQMCSPNKAVKSEKFPKAKRRYSALYELKDRNLDGI